MPGSPRARRELGHSFFRLFKLIPTIFKYQLFTCCRVAAKEGKSAVVCSQELGDELKVFWADEARLRHEFASNDRVWPLAKGRLGQGAAEVVRAPVGAARRFAQVVVEALSKEHLELVLDQDCHGRDKGQQRSRNRGRCSRTTLITD